MPIKRKGLIGLAVLAAAGAAVAVPAFSGASSHREAPAISQDPTADNTDVYAFRTPDDPATKFDESKTATLIANYVPFEEPAGGPNFHRFSDGVRYEIRVDNSGDGRAEIRYVFRFTTEFATPDSFHYNTGPVSYDAKKGEYTNLNTVQTYTVTKVYKRGRKHHSRVIGKGLLTPPNNVGPRSTPDYASKLVPPAIHRLKDGTKVFAGQRDDPFYVDLGGTFDLLGFRSAPPGAFEAGGDDGLTVAAASVVAVALLVWNLALIDSNDQLPSITVQGTTELPAGSATVSVLEDDTIVITAQDFPRLNLGSGYEVWLLGNGNPVSAGFLSGTEGDRALAVSADLTEVSGIAITAEPLSNTSAPTTPILAQSDLPT